MAAGFIGAVYATFGGVVWSAYEEFGHQSLLNLAPLVLADPAPLKVPPGDGAQDRTALPGQAGSDRSSESALDADERPGSASPMQPSRDAVRPDGSDTLVLAERAPSGTEAPPAPAFKPLDVLPTLIAQAALPPVRRDMVLMELGDGPPVPALKPLVLAFEQRPERAGEANPRRVGAMRPTLPDALRAFWTNLKILLAAGPAPRLLRAGADDSDRSDNRPGVRGDLGPASGGRNGGTNGLSPSSGSGDGPSGGGSGGNNGGSANGGGGVSVGGSSVGVGAGAGGGKGGGDKGSKGGRGSSGKDGGKGKGSGKGQGGGKGKGGRH